MSNSEVIRVGQQIVTEYLTDQLGLSRFAEGTSRHLWIDTRAEHIDGLHHQPEALVGEHALAPLTEAMEAAPDKATRQEMLQVVLHEQGDSESTQHLLDYIRDMWETIVRRIGRRS